MASNKVKDDRKILFIDIEWRPALAYVWRMWKQNIQPEMLVEHGGMLCFGAHWKGSNEYLFFSEWEHGRYGMALEALKLLEEADAVVHYNGDKYDLPKISGEILLAGLTPPPKVASIDLMKTVKKQGFNMNRLAYIAPLLRVGNKLKHQGFHLWKSVMDGDEKAQATMKKYCVQDVRVTVKLYEKIYPFIHNHPYLRPSPDKVKPECPACLSTKNQKRGLRYTRTFKIQRNKCTNCGHWFETTRQKITTNT